MIKKPVTILAPAKVNFILEILGKRKDGYHELRTVMHSLALHDRLRIGPNARGGIRISCNHPGVPCDARNLVYQAAEKLAHLAKRRPDVHIRLLKRIPVAAGMGGGSSDAAAALLGLARFWDIDNKRLLVRIAKTLGSDVPFFLDQGCALGLGRGERIRIWPSAPGLPLVVVNPGISVSTAAVYKKFSLRLTRKKACINMMRQAVQEKNAEKISRYLFNHLENVTVAMHPAIAKIKAELQKHGSLGVLMAGSGPTVFGLFRSHIAARRTARLLKKRFPTAIATQTSDPISW